MTIEKFSSLLSVFLLFLCVCSAEETEITWYGHSAFKIKTSQGHVLLIDPWITNPFNPNGKEDLNQLSKVDYLLITHGHDDHIGNAVEIAKKTNAKLITTYDLGHSLIENLGFPESLAPPETLGNFGGHVSILEDQVRIHYVPAVHSSCVVSADGKLHPGGNPAGFLIEIKEGPVIYHTGDTDLFSDMHLIPQIKKVDIMLVCIGGHFTMGPERAAEAVKIVNPKVAIPMHFGTFPLLKGTPEQFSAQLRQRGVESQMLLLKVGEPLSKIPTKYNPKSS